MNKTMKIFGAVTAALFLCPSLYAAAGGEITVDAYLPINQVQAYSSTFSIRTDGLGWASAQTIMTSATVPTGTFTDGSPSTATFSVKSFTALSSATATGTITVTSNTFSNGSSSAAFLSISGGGPTGVFNVTAPGGFQILADSAATACSLAAAINSFNVILATCTYGVSNGIVFTSAPYYGAQFNAPTFTINSSSQAALTVSNLISSSPATGLGTGGMSGGNNIASFAINGVSISLTGAFYPVSSTGTTAILISSAINNNPSLSGIVISSPVGAGNNNAGTVFTTSTVVGTGTFYSLFTSSQSALTIAPFTSSNTLTATGAMVGGTLSAYTINQSTISIPSNIFGTGEAVVYSTSTGVTIAPLVWGTTYFVIDIPPLRTGPNIMLALTSTGAVANTPIVFTSSFTKAGGDSFTLTPSTWTSAVGYNWVVSNDNTNWVPLTTTPFNISLSSVTIGVGAYTSAGTINIYDFGRMDYGWLGLNVTAPVNGAVNLQAKIIGHSQ